MSTDEGGRNPLDEPAKFTLDVARTYYPLRSVASSLWRTSLQTMRERFAEAARTNDRLTCVLTQSIIPEWPKRTEPPDPPAIASMEPVALGGGPRRELRQLFTKRENGEETVVSDVGRLLQKDWHLRILDKSQRIRLCGAEYEPLAGDRPAHNIDGKPIVFSDGEPVAMRLGASRRYIIYADRSRPDRAAFCQSFHSTATDAGRCLQGLPPEVNRILWRDWLDGFTTIDDKAMWINSLFELAWLRLPGSPLAADKFAWSGTTSIPLDALPHLRRHAEPMAGITDIPDSPAHWYSVLENLLSASVAAVDALLAIGDETKAKPADGKAAQAIPEPSEEVTNQQVIEKLEQQTPKLDTESVEWLAARKENEEKLGLPVETLRNYRAASKGGRKMPDEMFGVDRDRRRWRRQGTPKSTVYYFVPSLPKR